MSKCGACGKEQPPRALVRVGGFYPQPEVWGDWWRTHFIPCVYVCSARLACMRRIYGRGYQRDSFGEITNQDWAADRALRAANPTATTSEQEKRRENGGRATTVVAGSIPAGNPGSSPGSGASPASAEEEK